MIAQRVGRLSEPCRDVLISASVIGREFGLDALAQLSRMPPDELLDVLDEAMDERVLGDVPSGVFVGRARHNRVLSRNQFVIAESARSLVRDSSGNGNPAPDGDGIGVFDSQHLRILQNSFRRNALGMHVEDSTNIVIEQSRLSRSSDFGILLTADRNQVRGNRSVGDGITGISVAPGNRNVIAYNRIFAPPRGGRRRRGGHRHREGTRQPGRPAT